MNVDRMVALDIAHQLQVPLEGDVGVVPTLKQDLYAANGLALVDLGPDLFEAQHVPFMMLGPAIERAELAVGHTDVRVVDVTVDDVSDHVFRMVPPPLGISHLAELQQGRPLVELQIIFEFT